MIQLDFNPLLIYIRQRIRKNRNMIISVNGPTGSGKSYASLYLGLRLGELMGTNFSIKDNVDFSFSKLLQKMNLPENKKPGTVFVFEEVGSVDSGASAKQWQSKQNLFFNSFIQTARSRNQILIFNCPQFSFLEKSSRQLVHCQLSMTGIDTKKKVSYGKPFMLQSNSITGKQYFKYLRFNYQGTKHKFQQMIFQLPPKDIISEYESEKQKYLDELNKKIISADNGQKKKTGFKEITIPSDTLREYVRQGKSIAEISRIFRCSTRTITRRMVKANIMPSSGGCPTSETNASTI